MVSYSIMWPAHPCQPRDQDRGIATEPYSGEFLTGHSLAEAPDIPIHVPIEEREIYRLNEDSGSLIDGNQHDWEKDASYQSARLSSQDSTSDSLNRGQRRYLLRPLPISNSRGNPSDRWPRRRSIWRRERPARRANSLAVISGSSSTGAGFASACDVAHGFASKSQFAS